MSKNCGKMQSWGHNEDLLLVIIISDGDILLTRPSIHKTSIKHLIVIKIKCCNKNCKP